jgi:hypothetical protein
MGTSATKEEGFCRSLRKVQFGFKSIDALFRFPLSQARLRVVNSAHGFLERQQDLERKKKVYKPSTEKPVQT